LISLLRQKLNNNTKDKDKKVRNRYKRLYQFNLTIIISTSHVNNFNTMIPYSAENVIPTNENLKPRTIWATSRLDEIKYEP
jgi:hypothetical protein